MALDMDFENDPEGEFSHPLGRLSTPNADLRDAEYTESGHKKTAAFDDMNLNLNLIRGGKSR